MKVALMTDGLFPSMVGGMQRHSRALAEQLAGHGVEVDVYFPAVRGCEGMLAELAAVARLNPIPVEPEPAPPFPGHYLLEQYRLSRRMAALLLARRPTDVVYAKGFAAWHLLAHTPSRGRRPVAVNMHGYEMFQRVPQFRSRAESVMLRPAARRQLHRADAVISYGGGISSLLVDIGVPRDRIEEIPGALSASLPSVTPRHPSGTRRLLFVGRNERRKGAPELFRAIATLGADFPARFDIVGPFSPSASRQPNVVFHGEIRDTATLGRLYAEADVLLCPSYAEGFPNVILEGMASGVAPLATRVGAVDVLVDDANGWLIEPGRADVLERAIRDACALSDAALYAKKVASRERVERNHTWDVVAPRTIRVLERLAERR